MAINVVNLKKLPAGKTIGIITGAQVVDTVFDRSRGPEPTFALTIQPKKPEVGVYKALTVNFTPEINPLSAMGRLLERLNVDFSYDEPVFNENTLVGTEVSFNVEYESGSQFPRIVKDSIAAQ